MTEHVKDDDVQKADASQQRVTVRMSEIGNPGLKSVSGYVLDTSKSDLQFPRSTETFRLMREHPFIEAVYSAYESLIRKALYNGRFVSGPSRSEQSREFASYLNWNHRNLRGQTWYNVITDLLTCYQYGFSVLEKSWERNYSTDYPQYVWKARRFGPRQQSSISRWRFRGEHQDLIGLEQFPPTITSGFGDIIPNPVNFNQRLGNNRRISRDKFILASWNSTNNNPQGRSPLVACYKYWKEITLLENLEIVGTSKDMGGVIVLRAPIDLINKAQDPNSDEAKTIGALQKDAANLHAGEQAFIFLPSDVQGQNGNGNYLYDVTLQGIEGGGKQFSTQDLINERKKAILDVFGAGFLNTGSDVAGSYNLVEGQISFHAHILEDHLLFYKDIIENQYVAQMAALNTLPFTDQDMPRWENGDISEYSPDEIGKLIQRTFSVGGFAKTKENIIEMHRRMALDTTHLEEMTLEEILATMQVDAGSTSRAGESNGSSGTGDSQAAQGGSLNMENA